MRALAAAAGGARRVAIAAGAPLAIASAGLPLLAGVAWTGLVLRVDPARAADARAVRAWAVALAVTVVAGVVRGIALRSAPYALACAALLAGSAHLAARAALRLDATVAAGVGEPAPPWRTVDAGALAARPAVEVVDVADGRVHLAIDGVPARLAPGETASVGRYAARVVAVAPAPAFEITRPGGTVEGSGLLKLGTDARDFLEVGHLPHQFHVTAATGDAGPASDPAAAPARLRVRVYRGKLRVFDGVVAKDEIASFDGLGFSYGDGAAWAEIAVRRRVPWHLAVVSGALGLAAGGAAVARRRSRC